MSKYQNYQYVKNGYIRAKSENFSIIRIISLRDPTGYKSNFQLEDLGPHW